MISTSPSTTRLTSLDRLLLVVPTLAAFGLGLFPLLAASTFASLTNYPPNDRLIYWLAGAGTLGYAVALAIGIVQNDWVGLRFPIIAAFAFNVLTVIACIIEVAQGRAEGRPSLYVVLVLSALFSLLYAWLLYQHRADPRPAPDSARWLVAFFIFGTVAALGTGLLGYLAPDGFKPLFGLDAVNPFIYRVLGAATIGYGVMGIFEARSGRFAELRLALIMGGLFNALAVLLGIIALATGTPPLLPLTLLFAPVILTIGCVVALLRRGR